MYSVKYEDIESKEDVENDEKEDLDDVHVSRFTPNEFMAAFETIRGKFKHTEDVPDNDIINFLNK